MHFRGYKLLWQSELHLLRSVFKLFKHGRFDVIGRYFFNSADLGTTSQKQRKNQGGLCLCFDDAACKRCISKSVDIPIDTLILPLELSNIFRIFHFQCYFFNPVLSWPHFGRARKISRET